jgi:putative tryptophan/tyrosine transport system substrate-binding protein
MKRRDFIAGLGGVATWPVAARAQQTQRIPMVGFLSGSTLEALSGEVAAFHRGLADRGYVDATSLLNIVGRRIISIDCQLWRTISCAVA